MAATPATIGGVVLGAGAGTSVATNQGSVAALPQTVVSELAFTGTSSTVLLLVAALLSLLMGVLLLGLARRHQRAVPSSA